MPSTVPIKTRYVSPDTPAPQQVRKPNDTLRSLFPKKCAAMLAGPFKNTIHCGFAGKFRSSDGEFSLPEWRGLPAIASAKVPRFMDRDSDRSVQMLRPQRSKCMLVGPHYFGRVWRCRSDDGRPPFLRLSPSRVALTVSFMRILSHSAVGGPIRSSRKEVWLAPEEVGFHPDRGGMQTHRGDI